jgi:hypothetical protein
MMVEGDKFGNWVSTPTEIRSRGQNLIPTNDGN